MEDRFLFRGKQIDNGNGYKDIYMVSGREDISYGE